MCFRSMWLPRIHFRDFTLLPYFQQDIGVQGIRQRSAMAAEFWLSDLALRGADCQNPLDLRL